MRIVVVGGGIAGLAAARTVVEVLPDADIVVVERERSVGGKIVTQRTPDGFMVEGAPDSFLSRKPRGVGLCEELGIGGELVGRRPEHARSFVRRGSELHPLPEGLTGLIPTNLDALGESSLLSADGKERLAVEAELPPAAPGGDETIADFVTRRLGREAYEALVEPLMTGIYGGDGEQLSLAATFPNLRALELEHGSVLRGLRAAQPAEPSGYPPFVAPESGMETIVRKLIGALEGRIQSAAGLAAVRLTRRRGRYVVEVDDRLTFEADGVVLALPAFVAAALLAEVDGDLADEHAAIPYASSAIVTLAYRRADVEHPLDGYGYVVPRAEGSDVLACTWSSSKWENRAPEGFALLRVYAGRFGGRDVTVDSDGHLVALAREELRTLGVAAEPVRSWIHRWPRGMPQYVLGHPERLERIDALLERHPGLALAGAAYRGVGIPDCIQSGEEAARSIARALAGVAR
jgi:protoporphyrinogen/coproporphyrinogen III oxidase